MNNFNQNKEEQFANGQVSCDLQENSDAAEPDAVSAIEQSPDAAPEELPAPIGQLLGLMVTSSGAGRATIEFEASERYANPAGTLHGGVLCDLADAAMGVALSGSADPRRSRRRSCSLLLNKASFTTGASFAADGGKTAQ